MIPGWPLYASAIEGRHQDVQRKLKELTAASGTLSDFANAHKYFGLHRTKEGWVFREWAPNASAITLIGDFSGWKTLPEFRLRRVGGGLSGVWEGTFPADAIADGQLYKNACRMARRKRRAHTGLCQLSSPGPQYIYISRPRCMPPSEHLRGTTRVSSLTPPHC